MYMRDHARPAFHKALDVDIEWYDETVLKITSEITRQVFPIEIDLENVKWKSGLKKLCTIFNKMEKTKKSGGIIGKFKYYTFATRALMIFIGLYLLPSKKNIVPETSRLQPSY